MEKYYSKTHEWVKQNGDSAVIGITKFAVSQLGEDVSSVELLFDEGTDVIVGDTVATIETNKTSSDVFSPVSGTVCAINNHLDEDPDIVSRSPETHGWLFKLENIDFAEFEDLMDEEEYEEYLTTL